MGASRLPRLLAPAAIVLGLCWAARAGAQERVDFQRWEAGLGVGYRAPDVVFYGSALPASGIDLVVPFRLRHLRLEPDVGLSTTKDESSSVQSSSTSIEGAVGVFYGWALDHSTAAYVGTRAGLSHDWFKQSGQGISVRTEQTAWYVAPTGGAEVYLSPSFSLGAELSVAYSRYSQKGELHTGLGNPARKGWSLATRTLVIFRAYFWELGHGSAPDRPMSPVPAGPHPG